MVAVLVLHDNTASFPRRRESMVAVLVLHGNTASFPRRRESMVAVLVLHDNTASFPRRRESMVAVLVLHDNTPWLLCSSPCVRRVGGIHGCCARSCHDNYCVIPA